MNNKKHEISSVKIGSIAEELDIKVGDILISVNGKQIEDVFDYHYLIHDEEVLIDIIKQNGEEWELEIEKDYDEDIGIDFKQSLMDEYRSCKNKCMFCFIDQMPKGMRETLYFKDDDARLSFLQGNYITLTNMRDEDIERIILYKLAPINISVQATDKELRKKMLNNRFAGDLLDKIRKLYNGKIEMNSQIVLCKGYNDGDMLEKSIKDLSEFYPYMRSLSVVPVGLTKFRDGLVPLTKFNKEESRKVLKIIKRWQEEFLIRFGTRFVHASDEWYITAELLIPEEEQYEGYSQIENGVGMVRSLIDEVTKYLETIKGDNRKKEISLATGVLATPIIENIIKEIQSKFPNIKAKVYCITNNFFGEDITVAGLLTGKDIINQLKNKELGEYLILPDVLLKNNEEVLLDDCTITDIEKALQTTICIVQSDGKSLVETVVGGN